MGKGVTAYAFFFRLGGTGGFQSGEAMRSNITRRDTVDRRLVVSESLWLMIRLETLGGR